MPLLVIAYLLCMCLFLMFVFKAPDRDEDE